MRGNGVLISCPAALKAAVKKSFDHAVHRLQLRIRHLQINLRELRLAVGAQIFVAEAARDLEISVEAGDHQDLLEHLRRLRQRIETARLHAAGHQIIARAFGRGARHERRFDFEKSLLGKIVADRLRDLVPHLDVELHGIAAQINVAILQAHLFVGQNGFAGKNGGCFDSFRMRSSSTTSSTSPVGMFLLMVLASRCFTVPITAITYSLRRVSALAWAAAFSSLLKHHLRHAGAVAQIDENHAAVVAAAVDPSHEHGFFAGVGGAQRAALVGTL